jgi:hypothetical protein
MQQEGKRDRLSDIRFSYIPSHHAVSVEVVSVLADCVLHHPYPHMSVAVVEWDDGVFELMIEIL